MGTAGEVTVKFTDGRSEDLALQTGECGMLELVEKVRPFDYAGPESLKAVQLQVRM